MADYGMKIKLPGIAKDVEDCTPKELVFSSSYPCLKILQSAKYDFSIATGNSPTYTVALDADVAFPTVILVFIYNTADSSYKAIGSENVLDHTQNYRGSFSFDADELFVQVENYTGSTINSHFIYFIGYA